MKKFIASIALCGALNSACGTVGQYVIGLNREEVTSSPTADVTLEGPSFWFVAAGMGAELAAALTLNGLSNSTDDPTQAGNFHTAALAAGLVASVDLVVLLVQAFSETRIKSVRMKSVQ